ncbi:CP family cyanate transporter-like MFS transporter [Melghirimyces profundicolus]|uniref:CP family cyanate transporter-like MFS transporter n=1 Tax=Melghirimyces profundicolus TaxID=1242148 RepID=A0A2T6C0D6_9BACL|nr:MFS transporter [Melghirimyces profundicolus]PTX61793.1 CP family cyanate transporter-like MFS transporter [Melghirimyces profundicolus]
MANQEKGGTTAGILVSGVVFVAFNLRPALTSVGPLAGSIRGELGLPNLAIGMLTTLPLIVFGLLSPLAPKIGRRFGNERTILIGLIVLIAGIVIRSVSQTSGLFLGTLWVGVGIAICNVLLPGVIKERFPGKVGLMTSVYSTAMTTFAALGSGLSIPVAEGLELGWRGALGFWVIPAGIAAILWWPQLHVPGRSAALSPRETGSPGRRLWHSSLAWQVTGFMGLQSFAFYTTVAWLPIILQNRGMSVTDAGWLLSLALFVGVPATFVAPVLAERLPDQRGLAAGVSLLYFLGFAGLLAGEHDGGFVISSVLIGLAQGACVSLSFAFFGLRTATARQAAELSGMAQSAGYLLAAAGPSLIGWLFDATHSWTPPLTVLSAACLLMLLTGLGAGRNKQVDPPETEAG